MLNLLRILQKNLVYAIPVSMICGLIGGGYLFDAKPLKQFIIPITFVMIYPMMVTLNVKTILKGQDAKLQLVTQFINFVVVPIIVFSIGKIFFTGEAEKFGLLAVGLFLIGVLPASGMTISWTGFAKGNKEAATKILVFGLIIGAFAAPIYTKVFMGAIVDVDMLHMFQQICIFVFAPLIAGLLTQSYLIKRHGKKVWAERYKPNFPPFSALGVAMIAFKEQGTTIALLIAMVYLIQIQSAAWYIKLVPRIFGPVVEEE